MTWCSFKQLNLKRNSGFCEETYNTSCYIIFYEPMNWTSARDMCETAGFHLATIDDQGENDALQDIFFNGMFS